MGFIIVVWRKVCWVLEYQGFVRSIMIKLPTDCVIGSTRKFRGAAHTSMIQLDQVILLVPTKFLQLLNEDLAYVFAAS